MVKIEEVKLADFSLFRLAFFHVMFYYSDIFYYGDVLLHRRNVTGNVMLRRRYVTETLCYGDVLSRRRFVQRHFVRAPRLLPYGASQLCKKTNMNYQIQFVAFIIINLQYLLILLVLLYSERYTRGLFLFVSISLNL
jgi:hypothetical protein